MNTTIIKLVESHLESIPYTDMEYRTFIQNQIIRLYPQPTNEFGKRRRYNYVPTGPIHISIRPQLWKRYQAFLVSEYKSGKHTMETELVLDKMIYKTYKKVGKLYDRVNKHYQAISNYVNNLNKQ